MIKFFRHIRKKLLTDLPAGKAGNRLSKYLIYAVGEIILVLVGILLALQINNWNEHRKSLAAEKIVLQKLHQDLVTDSKQFDYYVDQYQRIEGLHNQLYKIGIENQMIDSLNDPSLIRRSIYFSQIVDNSYVDKANKIINVSVRDSLAKYTRQVTDLSFNFESELNPIVNNLIRPYLRKEKLVNAKNWFSIKERSQLVSDKSLYELNDKKIVNKEGLIRLSKTEEFQQILVESNIKWSEFYARLKPVIQSNENLRNVIEDYLN